MVHNRYLTNVYRSIIIITVALASLVSCSSKENFEFNLIIVQEAGTKDPACDGLARSSPQAIWENRYTIRMTFMHRDKEPVPARRLRSQYTLVCDRTIKPGEDANFQVPLTPGLRYTVRVDAFDATNKLAYSGQAESLDLEDTSATIFLRRAGGLSCVDPGQLPRAFHSATLLPNGQVLVLGGMVAEATGGSNKLHTNQERAYATGSAEIYDPTTLSFVTLQGSIPPRAFHRALLLPSPAAGPYRILLIGGVKPPKDDQPAFSLRVTSLSYPFLISPHSSATAAAAGLVTYTPAKEGQPAKLAYSATAELANIAMMFPSSARTPSGDDIVVAGGAAQYQHVSSSSQDKGFYPASSNLLQISASILKAFPFSMGRTRVGQAMAPLGNQRFLVLGGTQGGTCASTSDPKCNNDSAELISLSSGSPSSMVLSFASPPETVAWHSLTTIGYTDAQLSQDKSAPAPVAPKTALLAGGFPLTFETKALRAADDQQPVSHPLLLVNDGSPPTFQSISIAGAGHFAPVGYHQGTRLADGSVLLSGGNVNSQWVKNSPCGSESTPFCAYAQMVIYAYNGTQVQLRQSLSMRTGRFGHRATRLLDNTVLITGGIAFSGAVPVILKEAELFNPRLGAAAEDPYSRDAAADYDTTKGTQNHRCQLQQTD